MIIKSEIISKVEPAESCGTEGLAYDLGFHVAALFIVLGVSFLGIAAPFAIRKFAALKAVNVLSIVRMFGAGVLISTALVHMLGESHALLTNNCLPEAFLLYDSWAAALSILGILSTNLMQTILAHRTADSSESEQRLSVIVLEIGVAIHSVIIGIALGTSNQDKVVAILAAISFHQFFEGIAVSTLVAQYFYDMQLAALAMNVLATPIGVAIGIGIAQTYNENAVDALITQGILEALASGILIYDAIGNVVIPFFASKEYRHAPKSVQSAAFAAMWLGAICMSVIGYWA